MSTLMPTNLFQRQHIRLTPVDLEKDSQVIAGWTSALEVAAQMREDKPTRPMAAFEIKKLYERWQKEAEDSSRQFIFAIRLRASIDTENDDIIGVLRIMFVEWVHGAAYLDLILGDPQHWQEYSREALDLGLRYAFEELSLFRITAVIPEHNHEAHELFEQANFTLEVRQRQAVYWNMRAWDKLFYGLLRPEWKMQQLAEVAS